MAPLGAARALIIGGGLDLGKLELLNTTTISSSTPEFTTVLATSTYNVHLFTFMDIHLGSQSELSYQLSNDGGSSYEPTYQVGNQRIFENGTNDNRRAQQNTARLVGDMSNNALSAANGHMYLYNAGGSDKYTFSTSMMAFRSNADKCGIEFGVQTYPTSETINGIKFGLGAGSLAALDSGIISVYGLAEE
tara:strand:+ start:55 stop:627 length:573 start_codon:yes stop_codon:yes gene_type:complete